MVEIIIDAKDTAIGRLASFSAKQALNGNNIIIINSDKAIITGRKEEIIEKRKRFRRMGGTAMKGPYHSKNSEKILKRAIRGMLPDYRKGRGRDAWKRIKCFIGFPEEYKDKETKNIARSIPLKHITLEELKEKL